MPAEDNAPVADLNEAELHAAHLSEVAQKIQRQVPGDGKNSKISDIPPKPDLVLIDGGKGQLSVAEEVMAALGITDIILVGVAKGEDRKPGLETLIFGGSRRELNLPIDNSGFHLIQQIRDEAHRFAITGHRARRAK